MYTEFNGRVWSTEQSYLKFQSNISKNLKSALALENYADCNGDDEIYKDEAFVLLKEYRSKQKEMTEQQLLETTELIGKKFDELFSKIGREKFVFYEDGDVNFIWENN